MTASGISVLVVDDSAVVRQALRDLLGSDPRIARVDAAADGEIALRKIRLHPPDVVTLDVEMPVMDGIQALERIMDESPRPVIMLSAYTFEGADKTLRALELGAVDFVQKPSGRLARDIQAVAAELLAKIVEAATATVRRGARLPPTAAPGVRRSGRSTAADGAGGVVAIGASAGGTDAIRQVLSGLPEDLPAGVVITQHMPEGFTRAFANRLNSLCALEVKEAAPRDLVRPGRALLAPGHSHLIVHRDAWGTWVDLGRGPEVNGHRPAVDVMFESVADCIGADALGIVLTGMGRDGAVGLGRILRAGGATLAQDAASCVVFGMPKAAIEEGAAQRVLPLNRIPGEIRRWTLRRTEGDRPLPDRPERQDDPAEPGSGNPAGGRQ